MLCQSGMPWLRSTYSFKVNTVVSRPEPNAGDCLLRQITNHNHTYIYIYIYIYTLFQYISSSIQLDSTQFQSQPIQHLACAIGSCHLLEDPPLGHHPARFPPRLDTKKTTHKSQFRQRRLPSHYTLHQYEHDHARSTYLCESSSVAVPHIASIGQQQPAVCS